MHTYTQEDRNSDFDFFVKNYQCLFKQYGHKFLAIKNKQVLGSYSTIADAIHQLSDNYKPGTYIIQECNGDDSAYKVSIMRLMIKG